MAKTWGQIRFELAKFAPGVDPQLLNGWIRGAYHRILDYRNWKGLEVEGWIESVAAYTDGTVTVTAGSTAVTGASTVWLSQMTGRKFRVDGRNEWYTFTRTGATTGTLDREYEGDSGSALPYKIFQNVYELPEAAKFIQVISNLRTGLPLAIKGRRELDQISAGRLAYGEPSMFSPGSDTPEASPPVLHRVELYPIPELAAGYPYTYQSIPASFTGQNTSDSPLAWVSDDAISAFTKASILRHQKDYAGAEEEERQGGLFLTELSMQENERNGPVQIRMQPRFVRHRARRWSR